MSIRSLIRPSSIFMAKLGDQPAVHKRIERIAKEFEIFEYFSDHTPKFLSDKDWEQMLLHKNTRERVQFWMFKIKGQLCGEKHDAKSKDRRQVYDTYLDEQQRKFEAGGMAYGPRFHWLYKSKYEQRYGDAGRSVSPYAVGDMPQLVFDMQFATRYKLGMQKVISERLKETLLTNFRGIRRSFPVDIVNADLNDPNMADIFDRQGIYDRQDALEKLTVPYITADNPHQSTSDTDPRQQVVYISIHAREILDGPLIHKAYVIPFTLDQQKESLEARHTGKYRMMRLPIDKYIRWRTGPKILSFPNMVKILGDVASGEKWGRALANHVPLQNLIPAEEQRRSTQSTDAPSNKRASREKDVKEMVSMISRALGPENESERRSKNAEHCPLIKSVFAVIVLRHCV
ncbi:mitochondrial ribonuclease P protein 1 like protein [Ditylenchus destructor]|nr:mitochondrial ribonuclease P protein 1 like protein [Ditylenchus destructor]